MERPREKLLHYGPGALDHSELIAILIGSGTMHIPVSKIGRELIDLIENQPGRLYGISINDLCKVKGIGQIKAATILAAVELGKRALSQNLPPLQISHDDQVAAFLSPYLPGQESAGYFLVMLNARKEILATKEIRISPAQPPSVNDIVRLSLEAAASKIILARQAFDLDGTYLNTEKAFIIQLEAAACMLGLKFRGLLLLDNQP